jgi:uncharacterized protein (DUF924 family)
MTDAAAVLAFWFLGNPDRHRRRWFRVDPKFDALIRARFAATWEAARAGLLADWAETPEGALALVLVLDQFPRNMHRGTPLAFATDECARALARMAVAQGFDAALRPLERMFVYLPFQHAENLADQEESVRLFEALAPVRGFAKPGGPIDYALRHRAIIRRFGRFPHRNAILGRASSPDETTYLDQPGAGF